MVRLLILMICGCLAMGIAQAQEPDNLLRDTIPPIQDSLNVAQDTAKAETRRERRQREKEEAAAKEAAEPEIFKDSTRLAIEAKSRQAWRRSAIIPGWGQYTNGGLWWIKVPIIYGGLVSAVLVFEFNHRYYREYLAEAQYRQANNDAVGDPKFAFIGASAQGTQMFISAKDFYRRNRDLTILVTAGFYALNIVEAYVNSMLKYRWDIGDELSLKIGPTVIPSAPTTYAYVPATFGFKVSLNLNN